MPLVRELIEAPVVAPRPFGLFSVFEPVQKGDGHWQGGVEYESLNCEKVFRTAAAACAEPGTSEVQSVTITGAPTGGNYTLTIFGQTTTPIAYNAANATVQSALEALDAFEPGDVVVTGTATARVITFAGRYASEDVPLIAATNVVLTGGTAPAMTTGTTTPGVRTPKVTDPWGNTLKSFDPFALYAARSCSGPADFNRAKERSVAAFNAAEQRGVEAAIWARWTAAAGGVTVINATPQTRVKALAQAEQWAGDNYVGAPVMHARRALVTHLSIDLLSQHGKRLETKQGSPVVAGAGYTTNGPNGTAAVADVEWLFVTGQGRLTRSNLFASGPYLVQTPLDNTHTALTERQYVVDTDCILGAIAVTVA
jgi:hypothetical protein